MERAQTKIFYPRVIVIWNKSEDKKLVLNKTKINVYLLITTLTVTFLLFIQESSTFGAFVFMVSGRLTIIYVIMIVIVWFESICAFIWIAPPHTIYILIICTFILLHNNQAVWVLSGCILIWEEISVPCKESSLIRCFLISPFREYLD